MMRARRLLLLMVVVIEDAGDRVGGPVGSVPTPLPPLPPM